MQPEELCRVVAESDERIEAALIVGMGGKLIASYMKPAAKPPPPDQLPKMLIQSNLMIEMAKTNQSVTGNTNFIHISSEMFEVFFFPMRRDRLMIVPLPNPCTIDGIASKVASIISNQ